MTATSNAALPCDGSSRPASADHVRCACCGADVARGDAKACAICRQPVCPGCLGWYGHFMLACDDCRLSAW